MFHSARLKLTAWYLLIIMSISFLFSAAIYRSWMFDIEHMIRRQRYRMEREQFDIEIFEEARNRLLTRLAFINGVIFFLSGGLGYFLAGRTLKPIQHMMEEQNRFITDASHELRTPLTALRSEMEASLMDDKMTEKSAKKLIQSNIEEVIKLQSLSDNLIQLTNYSQQYKKLMFQTISILQVIDDALKKILPLSKRKHITITTQVKETFLYGDQTSLIQLFTILLDNAIKYSPEKTTITIRAKKNDHRIKIYLEDQGIGIEENDIPHIFDRFYRADKSRTKTEIPGYGLGLSIAKKIINVHNGTITAKSTMGKGTVFIISLPIHHS